MEEPNPWTENPFDDDNFDNADADELFPMNLNSYAVSAHRRKPAPTRKKMTSSTATKRKSKTKTSDSEWNPFTRGFWVEESKPRRKASKTRKVSKTKRTPRTKNHNVFVSTYSKSKSKKGKSKKITNYAQTKEKDARDFYKHYSTSSKK
jgi:hypothetical protein